MEKEKKTFGLNYNNKQFSKSSIMLYKLEARILFMEFRDVASIGPATAACSS